VDLFEHKSRGRGKRGVKKKCSVMCRKKILAFCVSRYKEKVTPLQARCGPEGG
jgi:hypothetical protein